MLAIFLDIETNGLNWQRHRSLELALRIVDLMDRSIVASYGQIVAQPKQEWDCSDPGSLKINGFTWEMVEKGKSEAEISNEVSALFAEAGIVRGKAIFVCQNPSFDRAFFGQLISPDLQEERQWPYHWLDLASIYWAWRKNETLAISKDAIATHLGLPSEAKPHRAMNGVDHLILCYFTLIDRIATDEHR